MLEFFYSIDVAVFLFINQTLSNAVGDFLWPLITDYDKLLPVRIVLLGTWIWLVIRGGKNGRTAAFLVIITLVCSDQLSSSVIKPIVDRARPCHEVNGVRKVEQVNLLVHCGSGRSFPSSHAVNNFAVATIFAFFYRKWMWAFFSWAAIVALSRTAVGVHYPSDIIAGALLGGSVALILIKIWEGAEPLIRRFMLQVKNRIAA